MKVTIENSKEAKFMVQLLRDNKKVGEISLKYHEYYPKTYGLFLDDYENKNRHFFSLFRGKERFQKNIEIDVDGNYLIIDGSPIKRISAKEIKIMTKNEFVHIDKEENDEVKKYELVIKDGVKKILIARTLDRIFNITLAEVNRIIKAKKKEIQLTEIQAKYLKEEIQDIADLKQK